MTKILKAKPVVESLTKDLQKDCKDLISKGCKPSLKVILVGEHGPSVVYTRKKKEFCEKIGADCEIVRLDENIQENDFLNSVSDIVQNPSVHGCLIQLPLPKHLSHIDVSRLVPASKDVDGFHPDNIFELLKGDKGQKSLLPCTAKGIISLLEFYEIPIERKNIVVIGRSMIVGKPTALLLDNYNATVTLCHKHTDDISQFFAAADIIISGIGQPKYFGEAYFADNRPIFIDVGTSVDSNGKLCGDADYEKIKPKVSAITPVPGGVGPMTVVSLAQNLLQAAKLSI